MRLARTVIATLLLAFAVSLSLRSATMAEDTAKQAVEAATRELQRALDEYSTVSREHLLLKQRVADLQERKRVAQERLQGSSP